MKTINPQPTYQVKKEGPAGEVVYDVSVTVTRNTVKSGKADVECACARLDAANGLFLDWVRGVEDQYDVEIFESVEAKRYDQLCRMRAEAEQIGIVRDVLGAANDDDLIDGRGQSAAIAVQRAILRVEKFVFAVGGTNDE